MAETIRQKALDTKTTPVTEEHAERISAQQPTSSYYADITLAIHEVAWSIRNSADKFTKLIEKIQKQEEERFAKANVIVHEGCCVTCGAVTGDE
jgi:hypothetical protein